MIVSTIISDFVLAACAIYALYAGALKHEGSGRLLWSVFFLAAAGAALLGLIRSMDNAWLMPASNVASLVVATIGSACLGLARWAAIVAKPQGRLIAGGLVVSLAVFAGAILLENVAIGFSLQGGVTLLLLVLGIVGLVQSKTRRVGFWLLVGTVTLVIAVVGRQWMVDNGITSPMLPIDAFHYVLCLVMLFYAKTARIAAERAV